MTLAAERRRGQALIRLALAAWVVVCATLVCAAPASAHARLVSTDPAEGAVLDTAPSAITLTFNEQVSLVPASTVLYDAAGAPVPTDGQSVNELVTIEPGEQLGDGTYVLTYRVISADGHPIAGGLSFSVGAPSESVVTPADTGTDRGVLWAQGLAHGATYVGLLLAAGLGVFLAFVVPLAGEVGGVRRVLLRWMRVSAIVAAGGAWLLVPLDVLYQQGLDLGGLTTSLPWTSWLSAGGLMAALVTLGLGLAAVAVAKGAPEARDRWWALLGVSIALGAVALVGHTRSFEPAWLVIGADIAHVIAAAVWLGGLVGLFVTLRRLADRDRDAAAVVARFSTIAGVSLAVVAAAGVLLGWRILGSWSALVSTTYGQLLLAKVAIVAVVSAIGGFNRFRLLADPSRVRRTVRLEAVGLVGVVLLTGFLVNQVPREQANAIVAGSGQGEHSGHGSGMAMMNGEAEGLSVMAHVEPAAIGENTVTIELTTPDGAPLTPYADPVLSLSSDAADLGNRPLTNLGGGEYEATVLIPSPGSWQIQVSVRLDEFTNPIVELDFDVAG